MFKLDLSKMKHVRSDDKTTTLRHPLGHEVTINHAVLAPHNAAALKALAQSSQTPEQTAESDNQKMANGGELNKSSASYPLSRPDAGHGKVIAKGEVENKGYGKVRTSDIKPGEIKMDMAAKRPQQLAGGGTASYPTSRPNNGWGRVIMKEGEDESQQPAMMADGGNLDQNVLGMAAKIAPLLMKNGGKANPISDAPDDQVPVEIPAGVADENPAFNRDPFQPKPDISSQLETVNPETGKLKPEFEGTEIPKMSADEVNGAKALTAGIAPKDIADNATGASKMQLSPDEQQSLAPAPNAQPQGANGVPDATGLMGDAYRQGMASANLGAKAAGQEAQERAAADKDMIAKEQAVNSIFQDNVSKIEKENGDIVTDIRNGYIDPNKYWTGYQAANGQQVPGHSKILTGIGMVLAGFNPTSAPNAAINMFQHQMEQSLDAQKTNLNSNHNLLRANLEHYKNIRDATDATRLQLASMLSHQIDMAAANAGTQKAQANAMAIKSQLSQSMIPLQMQLAMRQSLNDISNMGQKGQLPSGTLRHAIDKLDVLNPQMAKEYRARMSPIESDPLAAQPISDNDRDQMQARVKTDQAVRYLSDMVDKYQGKWGSLSPAERATAASAAQHLQIAYRNGAFPGVYKEGEQPLLDKAIKSENPLSMLNYFTEKPQLRELARQNNVDLNSLRKDKYQLPIIPLQPLDAEHDKMINKVNKRDGHTYQKIGNQLIRVK